jgi:BMFP domain-containing protein YqiC
LKTPRKQGLNRLAEFSVHHRGARYSTHAPFWGVVIQNGARNPHLTLAFSVSLRYQAFMSDNSVEDLARKLAESLPESLRAVREDIETSFRSVLKSGLTRLDLVTREEFEVQEAVLARTREKLEALEKRLAEFEEE